MVAMEMLINSWNGEGEIKTTIFAVGLSMKGKRTSERKKNFGVKLE